MQGLVKRLLFGGIAGKVLGVLRELVAAWCFGTGLVANAYRLAQAAFLLPLHGFVSDVVSGAFTPHYARLRATDPAAAQQLFAAMQRTLLAVAVLVAIGLVFLGDHLVAVMAPGFSASARELSARFVAVLAPALPAYVLVGLYGATELVHGHGRVLTARASVQSAGLLIGTLAAWVFGQPLLIAVGFVAAYLGLLVWAVRINRELGLSLTAKVGSWRSWRLTLTPVARVFLVLMWVPLALQVSQVVERRVASELEANAVAALDYARFITETLLILIAMPFGMAGQASMPTMDEATFRRHAVNSLRTLIIVGAPISVFLWAEATWIVKVALQRGAFSQQSVDVTSSILSAQALGVVFLLTGYAAQKFLNARGKNALVLWVAITGVAVSVAINLFLQRVFGVAVLGVSVAVAGVFVAILACYLLGLLRELCSKTWPCLSVAALHVCAIASFRYAFASHVGAEVALGALIWFLFIGIHGPSRRVVLDAVRAVRRR